MTIQAGQRFPAKEHARKVIKELLEVVRSSDQEVRITTGPVKEDRLTGQSAILVQGSPVLTRDDTDRELPFRESSLVQIYEGGLSREVDADGI